MGGSNWQEQLSGKYHWEELYKAGKGSGGESISHEQHQSIDLGIPWDFRACLLYTSPSPRDA